MRPVLPIFLLLICQLFYCTLVEGRPAHPVPGFSTVQPTDSTATPTTIDPTGQFKLKRLAATRFPLTALQVGDTLRLSFSTQDSGPVRSVFVLNQQGETLAAGQETSLFSAELTIEEGWLPMEVVVKASPGLKRTIGDLRSVRIPPVPDTTAWVRDTSYLNPVGQPNTDGFYYQDSMISVFQINRGDSLLRYRELVHTDANSVLRSRRKLVIKPQPQDSEVLLPRGEQRIRWWKSACFNYQGFEPGDTIFVSINAAGKKPRLVKRIQARDNFTTRKELGRVTYNTMAYQDTVVITEEEWLCYRLKGTPGLKRQFVDLQVVRQPPTLYDTVYQLTDSLFTRVVKPIQDTILAPIMDEVSSISNVLNIERLPFTTIPVQVPREAVPDAKLQGLFYWIGLSDASLAAFNTLEEEIAALWPAPGVSAAITAYGFERVKLLPRELSADLSFGFTNARNKDILERRLKSRGRLSDDLGPLIDGVGTLFQLDRQADTYGRLLAYPCSSLSSCKCDASCLGSRQERCEDCCSCAFYKTKTVDEVSQQTSYDFYLNFINDSAVNSYPLYVKIVGFYTLFQGWSERLELKDVRVQEIPLP